MIHTLAHDPYSARALLLGLLLDTDSGIREQQLLLINRQETSLADQLHKHELQFLQASRDSYLQYIERSLPAIKALSEQQYKQFKRLLLRVIQADKEIDLFEWTLYQMVTRFCDAHFGINREKQNYYTQIGQVAEHYAVVLSTLAHYGSDSEPDAERAFNRGAGNAGLYNLKMLPLGQCPREPFAAAVSELAAATPFIKQRLLQGMVKLILHDGEIVAVERELVTAIAAVMDSPLIGLDEQW